MDIATLQRLSSYDPTLVLEVLGGVGSGVKGHTTERQPVDKRALHQAAMKAHQAASKAHFAAWEHGSHLACEGIDG